MGGGRRVRVGRQGEIVGEQDSEDGKRMDNK